MDYVYYGDFMIIYFMIAAHLKDKTKKIFLTLKCISLLTSISKCISFLPDVSGLMLFVSSVSKLGIDSLLDAEVELELAFKANGMSGDFSSFISVLSFSVPKKHFIHLF